MSIPIFAWLLPWCGGCGGYYLLTVPDQIASPGGAAVPVARLQRNDFFVLALPVPDAPLRFQIANGPQRGCGTDEDGYGAVRFAAPAETGRYPLHVMLQDVEGEEINATVPLYVWDPSRAVLAVDLEVLPPEGSAGETAAAWALQSLACDLRILYLTRDQRPTQRSVHERLRRGGYPDGPVMLWQRERWRLDESGTIPRVVVESRLVSQLGELKLEFPGLWAGLCHSDLARKAFQAAGMKSVIVGPSTISGDDVVHRRTWTELAEQGI